MDFHAGLCESAALGGARRSAAQRCFLSIWRATLSVIANCRVRAVIQRVPLLAFAA